MYVNQTVKADRKQVVWHVQWITQFLGLRHALRESLSFFKEKLKKDTKLLEQIDFHKESCMLSNKDINVYYF